MPLYDYGCPSCGSEKELQHSMSEIGKIEVLCDSCGTQMKKMLSAPTLIGFDDVGRSISKKDKGTQKDKSKSSTSKNSPAKKDAAWHLSIILYTAIRHNKAIEAVIITPSTTGKKVLINVHFALFVSLNIVKIVVLQGL